MSEGPEPAQLATRKRIGRYQIQSLLGRGGMGEVYKAFDPSLDRTVALKTITAGANSPSLLERLMREARACGRLHHPGIVMVHDLGEADGVVFIAMEYLEGRNLADTLSAGTLSLAHKFQILIETLDALDYAHREGVVHRDIKPSNVHMMADGHIKLLDFGLARVTRADALTMTGEVMGTPHYMSPEQMKGKAIDGRTDIYSTGVMGYEMLTQRRAFDGETITAIILKVIGEPAPPMATPLSQALPEIEAIITRSIAKSPDDRYPTAREMADALQLVLDTQGDALARFDRESGANILSPEANTRTARPAHAPSAARRPTSDPDLDPTLVVTNTKKSPATATTRVEQPDDPTLRVLPSGGPAVVTPAPDNRRGWMWPALAAAVVVVGLGAFLLPRLGSGSPVQPAGTPSGAAAQTARGADPSAPNPTPALATATTPASVPDAQGTAKTTAVAAPPDQTTPPSTAAPAPASNGADTGASQTPDRSAGAGGGRRGQRGGLPPGAQRAVYVTGPTSPIAAAVTASLRTRGIERRPNAEFARWEINVHSDISVRKMPLGDGSLLTADYTGELTIHDRVSDRTETRPFDGHVAEAGEAIVRRKAMQELADRIADEIVAIIK